MSNWSAGRAQDSHCVFGFNTATITPAATAAASAVEQAFTIAVGVSIVPLLATDHVAISGPGSGNNVSLGGCRINSTGQLVIQFINPTAGSLTHAAGVFFVKISRL